MIPSHPSSSVSIWVLVHPLHPSDPWGWTEGSIQREGWGATVPSATRRCHVRRGRWWIEPKTTQDEIQKHPWDRPSPRGETEDAEDLCSIGGKTEAHWGQLPGTKRTVGTVHAEDTKAHVRVGDRVRKGTQNRFHRPSRCLDSFRWIPLGSTSSRWVRWTSDDEG